MRATETASRLYGAYGEGPATQALFNLAGTIDQLEDALRVVDRRTQEVRDRLKAGHALYGLTSIYGQSATDVETLAVKADTLARMAHALGVTDADIGALYGKEK